MQRKNTRLEKGIRVLALFVLICGMILPAFPFFEDVKQLKIEVLSLGLFILALDFVSKVFRFYKQANLIINTIWIISIIFIILGSAMHYFNWGWFVIAGWGIVAFNLTLGYSFFANKPEII